jgi:hypothetical protein
MVSWRRACVTAVTVSFIAAGCGTTNDVQDQRLSPQQLARCGSLGTPVTLTRLTRVFQAKGISLVIDESACRKPLKERTSGRLIAATNLGPSGLTQNDDVERREGTVFCNIWPKVAERTVYVVKFSSDQETHVRALNVTCAVYPSAAKREASQVARVRKALAATIRPFQ